MFKNEGENDSAFENLFRYLNAKKYRYINRALEYYKLALNGYDGFCFERDVSLITSVISIICDSVSDIDFEKQIRFAEKLYEMMDITDDTDKKIYLSNLKVCLFNPILVRECHKYWDIYLLFENKLIVSMVINYLSENSQFENEIIYYIKNARRYYVDERAFYSAILTVIQELTISNYDVTNEQLMIDMQNAGVYGVECVKNKVK